MVTVVMIVVKYSKDINRSEPRGIVVPRLSRHLYKGNTMPSIDTYTPFICVYCGAAAKFISINEKKPRCDKSVSRCPAIIKKS
jgi:hypothetical protein